MPRSLFILYTLAMGAVCAVAVALAVQSYGRAHHAAAWQRDAKAWQQRAAAASARDRAVVARYGAVKTMYDDLVAQAQKSQAALAAEIARTRAMKPRVVTGSTIVSYVNGQ
jgi:hypothetical protein